VKIPAEFFRDSIIAVDVEKVKRPYFLTTDRRRDAVRQPISGESWV
jgi:hypothetical protein